MSCIVKPRIGLFLIVLVFALVAPAMGDQQSQLGKQVFDKWHDAIVTVQLVVKTTASYNGENSPTMENKTEATGTVVSPAGLVIVSLAATNPEDAFAERAPKDMKVTSQITDAKIIMGSGLEIPAQVVLRDKDLDLIFVQPKQKQAKPFVAVDLQHAGKPGIFDDTIVLYRLGTVAGRSLAGSFGRIQAVIEKPRTFYVPGFGGTANSLGAPVFDMEAKLVGVLLMRSSPASGGRGSTFGGMGSLGLMYIVLPADDILDAANQAPK